MTRFLATASALALCTLPALAQEEVVIEEITIFSGLEETDIDATGVTADVITQDDIAQTNEVEVVDFLARQPGISVRAAGPTGTITGLTLRGISQNNIAVRIDGIDVSDPTGPQVSYDFGGLLTSDISRIEILRGSQSAVFGSEAIGGVINITTKRATEEGTRIEAFAEYGSFNTLRASVTGLHAGLGHETAVTLSYARSDGFSAADEDGRNAGTLSPNDTNDEADGFEAKRISFRGAYDLGEQLSLELSGFAEEGSYDYDESGLGTVYDGTPDDVTQRRQKGFRAALNLTTGAVDHSLAASVFTTERELSGTSIDTFGGGASAPYIGQPYDFNLTFKGRRTEINYQAGFDLGATARAVLGFGRTVENYDNSSFFDSGFGPFTSQSDYETTVNALYGEVTWAPTEDIDLSLALRRDDHSEFGIQNTGRLSAVWRARPDLILRANAATGYRAPSNFELFDVFSGNPDLTPETSKSFDLGIEKRYGDTAYVRATAFWIEAEDIIDYSFSTFGYVQRSGTATRKGFELAAGGQIANGITLDGNYTRTISEADVQLDSSSWSLSAPEHKFALSLDAQITDRARLNVSGLYEAERPGGLEDYGVLNTTFSYDVTDQAEAYLRIENLTDETYQTVPGYGQSGRAAFFGIRASF